MKYLMLLLALVSLQATAQEMHVDIHGGSFHMAQDHEFNEFNPGIGLSWDYADHGYQVGVIKNSEYRKSLYLSASYRLFDQEWISIQVGGGIISGYRNKYSRAMKGFSPLAYVSAIFNSRGLIQPVITLLPASTTAPALIFGGRMHF